ncbi:MAG: VCBS repeat-containing protein [Clostridia bacterium]|nr:VCBS repeat-containing protein [Clostridia bacterium]
MRRRIAVAQGDLTGDGMVETVLLTGTQQAGSAAWQQIALEIEDGASKRRVRLLLPQDVGYDPQITLGNMSGRDKSDVLISIDSGGSGGIGYYTVYSYMNGMYRIIFDSESYNAALPYRVVFLENYVVRAESLANGMIYLIDISGRDEEYLRGIYNADGTLRREQSGFVDPLSLLYPADVNRDGVLELVAWQRISGLYHADGLGDFINTLTWTGQQFALSGQTVGIFGESRQM